MRKQDIPAINRLQAECYPPEMQEDESTIHARLLLAPDLAWVAEDDSGVCAYLVGYRSAIGKITPLNGLSRVEENADTLYLHDLAVSHRGKGQGIGMALAKVACHDAAEMGLTYSALVSVQGSSDFWKKLGYVKWDRLEPDQLVNLKTYPGPSFYMIKKLRDEQHPHK